MRHNEQTNRTRIFDLHGLRHHIGLIGGIPPSLSLNYFESCFLLFTMPFVAHQIGDFELFLHTDPENECRIPHAKVLAWTATADANYFWF